MNTLAFYLHVAHSSPKSFLTKAYHSKEFK